MENKKKIRLLVLGTLFFVTALVGLTWAFFSYVYVGGDNIVKTGDITFEADYTSVTLTDVFPISASKVDTDTDNVVTVNVSIRGKTSYENGVYYKVMAEDVNLLSNNNNVPINVVVSSSNLSNVKTIDYKDEMVIVDNSVLAQGTIYPSDGEVDGLITIKAYVSSNNVVISDTYDGTESDYMGTTNEFVNGREVFTTEEWNSLGNDNSISFKIKVVANVDYGESLYDVLVDNAVLDNIASEYVESETGIDFTKISSNTNGRGLYMMADTKDDTYPIMYYRGNVDNNNVMFANYCWKMVRTTETGGIKLIYNGTPVDTYEKTMLKQEDYNVTTNNGFTYDESSDYWKLTTAYTTGELSFTVPEYDNYIVDVSGYGSIGSNTGTYSITNNSTNILNGTLSQYGAVTNNKEIGALTGSNTITINLTGTGWNWFYIRLIKKGDLIGTGCDNVGSSVYVKGGAFNTKTNSLAYNGYMYNKVYEYVDEAPVENAYFANDVIYVNGVYQLQNAEIGFASNRHYTCNSIDSAEKCETIRYYITGTRYIELTDGKKISDAVEEMTSVSDINQTDSNAKIELETWYSSNLLKYANNIEDTVWCNDRSISSLGAFSTTGSSYLLYKTYSRATTKNINLKCENEVDNFSMKNRLAQINYPIGLLTSDEIKLAGVASIGVANTNCYLYTKTYYWTMSPSDFGPSDSGAYGFFVATYGNLNRYDVSYSYGLRPSVSLAFGTAYTEGDGTVGNPYVIAEN